MTDSFKSRSTITSGGKSFQVWSLPALGAERMARLPYSLKILLENLLRFEDGVKVTRADIEALRTGIRGEAGQRDRLSPARVILQDFTGVPCVVDLAAMRDAMRRWAAIRKEINPLAAR